MYLLRPYPDELVGSMLHRAERLLGIGCEQLLERLTRHRLSSHSFLVTQYVGIAEAHGMSLEEFLLGHTVLPYMTAYMGAKDRNRVFSAFLDAEYRNHRLAPLTRHATLGEWWLRLCPHCVEEELLRFGESYWHRAHQLSAVQVCVKHDADLLVTGIRISRAHGIPPPHEVEHFQPHCYPELSKEIRRLIAETSTYALLYGAADRDHLIWAYQKRARELGYVYLGGKIHGTLLAHDLQHFFGESLLSRYSCAIGIKRKGRWPAKLFYESSQHATTFRHILLQVFLNSGPVPSATREDFENRPNLKTRDWKQVEREAIARLDDEVAHHKAARTRANIRDLYELAHIRSVVAHYPHQVPLLMAWLQQFKTSPQSSRVPGRRPKS